MNAPGDRHERSRLSRIWDDLASGTPSQHVDDAALLDDIRLVERATRVPAPPPDLKIRIWTDLMHQAAPVAPKALVVTPNGHHPDLEIPSRQVARFHLPRATMLAIYRQVAIGVMAGFAAGFLTGLWTRAAMRVAGLLTIDRNRGLLTENDAVVGQMTLAGTLSLAMFGGLIGVAGGLIYIALRAWLPRIGWLRALAYGILLLAVFGFVVMDPDNPDYRRFGPPWVNVLTFSLAYVICGVAISAVADRLDRQIPRLTTDRAHRARTLCWTGVLAPFAAIGVVAILTALANVVASGIVLILVLPLAGVLGWLALGRRAKRDTAWQRWAGIARYVALAAPAALGLFVTVRSVFDILAG